MGTGKQTVGVARDKRGYGGKTLCSVNDKQQPFSGCLNALFIDYFFTIP